MIKKIKIEKVFIKDEKEIVSTKEKTKGNKYKLCEVSVLVADDNPDYAGEWLNTSIFAYEDKKDAKRNRTATDSANYFKTENEGKEVWLDIEEQKYVSKKDGTEHTSLKFKKLGKKEIEVLTKAGVIK